MPTLFKCWVDKVDFAINDVGINSGSLRLFGVRCLFELILGSVMLVFTDV